MFTKTLVTIIATTFLLIGCGPAYDTIDTWQAPASAASTGCVQTCLMIQHSCKNQCHIAQQHCLTESTTHGASHQHTAKKTQAQATSKQPWRSVTAMTPPAKQQNTASTVAPSVTTVQCQQPCSCDDDYRICFTSCGGQVIPHQKCVFNCPSAK